MLTYSQCSNLLLHVQIHRGHRAAVDEASVLCSGISTQQKHHPPRFEAREHFACQQQE